MQPSTPAPVPLSPTQPSPSAAHDRRWWIVGLLFTASLINYFDRATISMAVPMIAQELHLGPTTKGVLLSAFFWSYALMQIPIGWCADRFNLRWLYAGAFALWSLSQGLTGFASSLGMLIFFRVLLGVGESIYLPGGTKIVSLLFKPEERGFPCGIFDFGTRTGLVVEGLLLPWMLKHYGWRTTFMVVGFTALLWLIPWLMLFKTSMFPARKTAVVIDVRAGAQHALRLLKNRNLIGICLGFFCFDYYWYFLVTWLFDYLVNVRHLTLLSAGIYTSLPYFVFGISEPIGGWIADRLIRSGVNETKARKGLVTVAFMTGLFLIPAAQVQTPQAALLCIIGGSFVGLATGNLLVILQCCAPLEEVGLWTGIENFAGNIAGILAPIMTGVLISVTHSYTPPFFLSAGMLIAGLMFYLLMVGDLKRPAIIHQR